MRLCFVTIVLLSSLTTIAQPELFTQTRVGINRIGLGLDQGVGINFGKGKAHSLLIGAKWYGLDVVFFKESVGLVMDYRYNFKAVEMPMRFSIGLSTAVFSEKNESFKSLVSEFIIYNRGELQKWNRLKPFYEIGTGIVLNSASSTIETNTLSYFNYSLALGIQFNICSFNG